MKLGFIGMGNMGYAMMRGAMEIYNDMSFFDVNKERMEFVKKETNIEYENSNQELVKASDIIVFAVKPQYIAEMLINLKIDDSKIVISIAPGVTIEYLRGIISGDPKIVRAMPNTPALVGEGMSGISFENNKFTEQEKQQVIRLFNSFGKCVEVEEKHMDAVVAISGSSPAYVYMFIEAMADAGVLHGLPRKEAYTLAAQAIMGSAKMVLDTNKHPGELKDMVTSPAGTTIEAVRSLEKSGFRSAVIEAMDKCVKKSKKLGEN